MAAVRVVVLQGIVTEVQAQIVFLAVSHQLAVRQAGLRVTCRRLVGVGLVVRQVMERIRTGRQAQQIKVLPVATQMVKVLVLGAAAVAVQVRQVATLQEVVQVLVALKSLGRVEMV